LLNKNYLAPGILQGRMGAMYRDNMFHKLLYQQYVANNARTLLKSIGTGNGIVVKFAQIVFQAHGGAPT
jgi:translation elongation factor EF-Ts